MQSKSNHSPKTTHGTEAHRGGHAQGTELDQEEANVVPVGVSGVLGRLGVHPLQVLGHKGAQGRPVVLHVGHCVGDVLEGTLVAGGVWRGMGGGGGGPRVCLARGRGGTKAGGRIGEGAGAPRQRKTEGVNIKQQRAHGCAQASMAGRGHGATGVGASGRPLTPAHPTGQPDHTHHGEASTMGPTTNAISSPVV